MSKFPIVRMRRTRQNERPRSLVRETYLAVEQLIYLLFIAAGLRELREVASMPGIMQCPVEQVGREAERVAGLAIPAVPLFGLPKEQDEVGIWSRGEVGRPLRDHPYSSSPTTSTLRRKQLHD